MARNNKAGIAIICIVLIWLSFTVPEWGFYAHRKINYYAVLTVPPPVNQFFKSHIEYLRSQAVGPDQRRYALPDEGARHFIDLDRWMKNDSLLLSKDYTLDRILQGKWTWDSEDLTVPLISRETGVGRITFTGDDIRLSIDSFALRQEVYGVPSDSVVRIAPSFYPDRKGNLLFMDSLTVHGIVPYYVERLYHVLIRQMMEKDLLGILRTAADMGHYIADAHVPLHTTSNYNGQLTGQLGIHAFWESRIPELFEESDFNSLVGRARYIDDIHEFMWTSIRHSHSLVPVVLKKEKEARRIVAEQNHYCYEERGSGLVRTQCPQLAREYMNLMDGMVQEQWRAAIRAVGSVWYSAWIDAGQPDLWTEEVIKLQDTNLMDRIRDRFQRRVGQRRSDIH